MTEDEYIQGHGVRNRKPLPVEMEDETPLDELFTELSAKVTPKRCSADGPSTLTYTRKKNGEAR